jgi:hypothetical protein
MNVLVCRVCFREQSAPYDPFRALQIVSSRELAATENCSHRLVRHDDVQVLAVRSRDSSASCFDPFFPRLKLDSFRLEWNTLCDSRERVRI